MPVGAALGAGALGAGASVYGADKQASAAKKAAQLSQQQYQQTRADLSPYRDAGSSVLPGIQALLGIGGGQAGGTDWAGYLQANPDAQSWVAQKQAEGSNMTSDMLAQQHYEMDGSRRGLPTFAADYNPQQSMLESLPGYQFTRDQGMKAITNSMSARGLGGASGAFGKGLARFVTGLADSTYGSQLDRLMNVATMGQNAANQTGSYGATAAQGAGNAYMNAGTAQAAGAVGAANSLGNAAYAPYMSKMLGMYGSGSAGGGGFYDYQKYQGGPSYDANTQWAPY